MESVAPSGEYHTRSTGPEASPARDRSNKEFPEWYQSEASWALKGNGASNSARAPANWRAPERRVKARRRLKPAPRSLPPLAVALLHIKRVHCILTHRFFGRKTVDFSDAFMNLHRVKQL